MSSDPKDNLDPNLFLHSSFCPLDKVKSKEQAAEELDKILQEIDKQHLEVITAVQTYFAWYANWRWKASLKAYRGIKREVTKIKEALSAEGKPMATWRQLYKHTATLRRIDSMLDGTYEMRKSVITPETHINNFKKTISEDSNNDIKKQE